MDRAFLVGVVAVLLVGACHDPWSTGPYGIRGRLTDNSGQPLVLKKVFSEEHGDMTEGDGSFVVRWKDPATFVDTHHEGITYRRRWLQEEDAAQVHIQLPETQPATITCRSDVECVAEVQWDLGKGLTARLDVECGDTAAVRVEGLPPKLPTQVTCPSVMGDRPMDVTRVGNELHIDARPLASPLTIDGPNRDASCSVEILDGKLERGQGVWGLQPSGPTWAWAVCEGRSGSPVAVSPRASGLRDEEAKVVLPWAAVGPDLVLPEPLPMPRTMMLVRRELGANKGWKMTVEPTGDRRYALPPLPAGQYLLGFGAASLFAGTNPPEPEVPGLVYMLQDGAVWNEDGGMIGALSLEEALVSGEIEVELQGTAPSP